jgi:hypothetical protein
VSQSACKNHMVGFSGEMFEFFEKITIKNARTSVVYIFHRGAIGLFTFFVIFTLLFEIISSNLLFFLFVF